MGLRDPDFARLLCAHTKKRHDRVPNFEIAIDPLALARITGWNQEGLTRSDTLLPEKQVELAKIICEDAIICNAQSWLSKSGEISSMEILEQIEQNEPDYSKYRQKVLDCQRAVSQTNIGVGAMLAGPLFTTYWCVGPIPIQSFMLLLYDDIEMVKRAMNLQTQRQIKIIKAMENTGIGFVEIAEDLCDNRGPLIPLPVLEEIWWENMQKLVHAIKTHLKVPIQFHCCGKVDKVIPYFIKLGVNTITPIQTNVNDIYGLYKEYGSKLSFAGNLSIDGVLAFGTPDEVAAETKRLIDTMGRNGNYIAASSHSIIDTIPKENFFAMIETAVTYGAF